MIIKYPALIFLGDGNDLDAKTGHGIHYWRPQNCLAQYRLPGGTADLGLPNMTPDEAAAAGARALVIGVANGGGVIPDHWLPTLVCALESGLDIAAGLHDRLNDNALLVENAQRLGRTLLDVRRLSATSFLIGNGVNRPGKRLLTVGTDCAVGKMYTALAIEKALKQRGISSDFRATGQTGIFIAGSGVAIDAVVSDFLAGAVERLSPANDAEHWDLIEGQGSVFHPAYAGVTMGLIHGSQPDALVLCHEIGRSGMNDAENFQLPSIEESLDLNLQIARRTNPAARFAGIAFNTSQLGEADAIDHLNRAQAEFGLPCCDPVRTGVDRIVEHLCASF